MSEPEEGGKPSRADDPRLRKDWVDPAKFPKREPPEDPFDPMATGCLVALGALGLLGGTCMISSL